MANSKAGKRGIRKLTRIGRTSLAVTLPIELVKSLGWREKQKVSVKKIKGGFTVRDSKKK